MSSENIINKAELTIPEFGNSQALVLNISSVKEGERRLIEAKNVTPTSYADLEYVFGEGYREAKKNVTAIGYEITKAQKALREAQSIAILDYYKDFLKEKGFKDSAYIKDVFLQTRPDYVAAQDRIDMLKAMLDLMEGKIKVFENVSRWMKKEIDMITKSGMDYNKYMR